MSKRLFILICFLFLVYASSHRLRTIHGQSHCSNTQLGQGVICINSASALSSDTNNVTLNNFNATGATTLIVTVSQLLSASVNCVLSSTPSYTWVPVLGPQGNSTVGMREQLFYVNNITGVSNTTISCNGAADYPSVSIAAFTGLYLAANPLDQKNGNSTPTAYPNDDANLTTGSITTSNSGQLIIVGLNHADEATLTIDSGLTIFENQNTVNGLSFGTALAMKTVGVPTTINATWTPNVNFRGVNTIASFATTALCPGASPTWTANSWNLVQNCHDVAIDGDTIKVAAGTYHVTFSTQISKAVTIQPQTPNTVTLIDDSCNVLGCTGINNTIIAVNLTANGSSRITGFTWQSGIAQHGNPGGAIYYYGNGKVPVLQNNTFNDLGNHGDQVWIFFQVNKGLVTGNTANFTPNGPNCLTQAEWIQVEPFGTVSDWATPVVYGNNDTNQDQAVYIENNTRNWGGIIDLLSNGRVVFRNNTGKNAPLSLHGIADVNGRFYDIYNNAFISDRTLNPGTCTGGNDENNNGWITSGGGVLLIHNNRIDSANTLAWGPKTAVGFSMDRLTRNATIWPCWDAGDPTPGGGYPSPEQVGWGFVNAQSSMAVGPPGNQQVQGIEPLYIWGNTGDPGGAGNYDNPALVPYNASSNGGGSDIGCATAGIAGPYQSIFDYIKEGREYFLNVDMPGGKPGYTPAPYPHPLTNGGNNNPPPTSNNGTKRRPQRRR